MSIKSASGIVIYAHDLDLSKKFYESLGFEAKKTTPTSVTFYINWFWIELRREIVETNDPIAGGPIIYIKVDSADEYYEKLVGQGIDPGNKPQNTENGLREFSVCDPDGCIIAFFSKE